MQLEIVVKPEFWQKESKLISINMVLTVNDRYVMTKVIEPIDFLDNSMIDIMFDSAKIQFKDGIKKWRSK